MAILSVNSSQNPAKLKEYVSQVPMTMKPFGAKMLARGKVQRC